MPVAAAQDSLRRVFARWGLPRHIRVDNGSPWGSTGELPTDLALWLIGLGIEMIWNPPRRPQANGVIERSQGTGKRWAEPQTCGDVAELQARVDEQDRIQRELYPSIDRRSRLEAYPELKHSGRPYSAGGEASRWELDRVLRHLSGYVVVRQVDSGGTFSLYNRSRFVGRLLAGCPVYVTLDPVGVEWVYSNREGMCYRRQKAEELTAERILKLDVSRRRKRTKPSERYPDQTE